MAISDEERAAFEGMGEHKVRADLPRGAIYPYSDRAAAEWLEDVSTPNRLARESNDLARSANALALLANHRAQTASAIAIASIMITIASTIIAVFFHH